MSRITLIDVAAKVGVSYQTVSKVLNGQIQVTEETETRIWQAITDLDYRPNVSARNLRTQASNLIGHALPGDAVQAYQPILVQFMISVANATERLGYHLLSFVTGAKDFYSHQSYDQLYARNQVAGFILSNTTQNDPRIPYLMERGIPFCSFGRANKATRRQYDTTHITTMIEVEIYAPGLRKESAMMQLRNQMDHFPRGRYKVDARHDLVYFEIDRPGDLSQQEIHQIFEAIDLSPRFVGQIPEDLRSGASTTRLI